MADEKAKHEAANDPGQAAPETPEIGAETGAEAAASEGAAPDEATRLAEEVASLKDQLLRALAETENLRRRSRRERDDAVRYAAAPLIKDLIGVADNLRRALDSIPAEAVAGNEQVKALRDGIAMTENELLSVFERHGIERLVPLGERLDPHNHEALFEIPDPTTPAGTVLQVLRPGYRLHERLLRPAQVGVARGGPAAKAVPEADAAPDSGPDAGRETPGDTGDKAGNGAGDKSAGAAEKPGSRYDTTA